ncbi:hypothetical protein [Pseudomonas serbica]|jgi:hypothetical protein|uniref:hypothetical protein n=1 Tax=Pseudomonas serbica TaxID=2965074 RepID=UPI00237C1F90|nr:hypothetical protein [Pseudomonas serbica]
MEVTEALPVGTKVQFTERYLVRGGEKQIRKYKGRVGEITGYRGQREFPGHVKQPTVVFPKMGRYKEEKIFEPQWKDLELAESKA